ETAERPHLTSGSTASAETEDLRPRSIACSSMRLDTQDMAPEPTLPRPRNTTSSMGRMAERWISWPVDGRRIGSNFVMLDGILVEIQPETRTGRDLDLAVAKCIEFLGF